MKKEKPDIIKTLEDHLGPANKEGYTYTWERNNHHLKAFSNNPRFLDITIRKTHTVKLKDGDFLKYPVNKAILSCTFYINHVNIEKIISLLYKNHLVPLYSEKAAD